MTNFEFNKRIEAEDLIPFIDPRRVAAALSETNLTSYQIGQSLGMNSSTVASIARKHKKHDLLNSRNNLTFGDLVKLAEQVRDVLNEKEGPMSDIFQDSSSDTDDQGRDTVKSEVVPLTVKYDTVLPQVATFTKK